MSGRPAHWLLPRALRLWWYRFFKSLLMLWLTVCYQIRAFGKKNLPATGGYVIVSNHQSLHDPPIIGTNVKGEFHPLARSTLFDIPIFGWGIANCNAIPVDQSGGQDRAAIQTCIDRVRSGGVVAVFPEGSRSYDGELQPFLAGASLIARKSHAPVVPAAIHGAFDAWPRGRKLPRLFGRIRVKFGKPIPAERIAGLKSAEVTELIESEVRRLFEELRKGS